MAPFCRTMPLFVGRALDNSRECCFVMIGWVSPPFRGNTRNLGTCARRVTCAGACFRYTVAMSDTPVKKPLLPGGSRRDNDEAKVGDDGMLLPDYQCDRPLRVIGVQKETPVCWSRDGKKLCFVLGNKTLVIHEAIADGPRAGEFQVGNSATSLTWPRCWRLTLHAAMLCPWCCVRLHR